MHKLAIYTAVAALGLGALPEEALDGRAPQLKEERVFIEYTPQFDEAVVVLEAESEVGLQRVEVLGPLGESALSMRAEDLGGRSISGFVVETTEATLGEVLAAYGEGRYEMLARTQNGKLARGSALLVHQLLERPVIQYPLEGATGVPASGLTVTWTPDPAAGGYTVILEQGDNDGLTVQLPAGSSSLSIPDGVLRPGTETLLEIGVLGPNGNCTLSEVEFTTL